MATKLETSEKIEREPFAINSENLKVILLDIIPKNYFIPPYGPRSIMEYLKKKYGFSNNDKGAVLMISLSSLVDNDLVKVKLEYINNQIRPIFKRLV
jgi:hypothetical protein